MGCIELKFFPLVEGYQEYGNFHDSMCAFYRLYTRVRYHVNHSTMAKKMSNEVAVRLKELFVADPQVIVTWPALLLFTGLILAVFSIGDYCVTHKYRKK